jgi:hypothetical protein
MAVLHHGLQLCVTHARDVLQAASGSGTKLLLRMSIISLYGPSKPQEGQCKTVRFSTTQSDQNELNNK